MTFIITFALACAVLVGVSLYYSFRKKQFEKTYKVAIDIHGVSDAAPEFFATITQLLCLTEGCEVHILTGAEITPEITQLLRENGIHYTHLFSITDYHKAKGTEVKYLKPGHPIIDPVLWDKTKAIYCKENNINVCLDDSPIYGQYFEDSTVYIQVKVIKKKKEEIQTNKKAA